MVAHPAHVAVAGADGGGHGVRRRQTTAERTPRRVGPGTERPFDAPQHADATAVSSPAEQHRMAVDALAEGVLIHDPAGRIGACNASAARILGVEREDLLGADLGGIGLRWFRAGGSPLPADELPPSTTLSTHEPVVDQIIGVRRPAGELVRAERGGGQTRWLRVNVRLLDVPGDTAPPAVTSFNDVTAERQMEDDLAQRAEFQALVASISTRLIGCLPDLVDATICEALGEVARFFDADVGYIDELSPDGATLRLTHEWRRSGAGPRRPETTSASLDDYGWAVRLFEDKPYIFARSLDDLPADADSGRVAMSGADNKALLWVRLGGQLDLAGIAGLVWKHWLPAAGEEQVLSLVRLAGEAFLSALRRRDVAQLASGQARVFELIARGAPLEETLDAVARLLASRTPAAAGAVLVRDADGRSFRLVAAPGLDSEQRHRLDGVAVLSTTPVGEAAREVRAVVAPDVAADPRFLDPPPDDRAGARSIVAAPIVSSRTGRVLGVLQLQGARPHSTDGLDPARRDICAVLAAVAIERAEDEALLAHQATHDPLTGLANRSALLDRLDLALARCQRSGRSVAVLFCDLDRFKHVNDAHGHAQGDALLVEAAGRLQRVLRPSDSVSRFGGDEFVVLCEDIDRADQAVQLADRIAAAMHDEPVVLDGTEITVTASIGIAVSTGDATDPEELVADADFAMYRAKARGRARHELASGERRTPRAATTSTIVRGKPAEPPIRSRSGPSG